jgi:hypothetical protein
MDRGDLLGGEGAAENEEIVDASVEAAYVVGIDESLACQLPISGKAKSNSLRPGSSAG